MGYTTPSGEGMQTNHTRPPDRESWAGKNRHAENEPQLNGVNCLGIDRFEWIERRGLASVNESDVARVQVEKVNSESAHRGEDDFNARPLLAELLALVLAPLLQDFRAEIRGFVQ